MLKIYLDYEKQWVLNFLMRGRFVLILWGYDPDFHSASANMLLMMFFWVEYIRLQVRTTMNKCHKTILTQFSELID